MRGCQAVHLFCLNPDGGYLTNENFCSCESCIQCKYWLCTQKKVLYFPSMHLNNSCDEDVAVVMMTVTMIIVATINLVKMMRHMNWDRIMLI